MYAPPTWSGDPFFEDIPLVLTASRLAQSPLDAPAPVTVIDREMIKASGFTEIHDLLRLAPGFLVADWPGGAPTVANHGLGDAFDRRIKVMIDGRTVNVPLQGDTHWLDLPVQIDEIERIEVVRSPHGGSYGVNAFQGAINIITRHPATEDGFTVVARAGRDGFYHHGVRLNSPTGGLVDWRLTASTRRAENFHPYLNHDRDTHAQETNRRKVFNFQASTQLSAQDELRLHIGLTDGVDRRGHPPGAARSNLFPLRNEEVNTRYLHLGWTHSFDADSALTLQYYHQGRRLRAGWEARDNVQVTVAPGVTVTLPLEVPVNVDMDFARHDLELQFDTRLSPTLHLLAGLGARQEAVRSDTYFWSQGRVRRNHWHSFGALDWQPDEAWRVNLAATYERHGYSGHLLSPRLAVNYAFTPVSTARLSAGRSWRAPALMESDIEWVTQIPLPEGLPLSSLPWVAAHAGLPVKPEEVRYVELGYLAHWRQYGLKLDTRVFHERYRDFIDSQNCELRDAPCGFSPLFPFYVGNAAYFRNMGRFVLQGAEFTLDWRKPGWGGVVLSQAYAQIRAQDRLDDDKLERSAPRSTTSLLLIKDLPGRWRASLGYYHTQRMAWMNDGGELPSRDRIDLKLARGFGAPGSDNEFSITVQNGGARYTEFHAKQYRQQARVFATLRHSW